MGFFSWLQETSLAIWVQESLWGYPYVLSSHATGMAIVVGVALMFNLRVLGFAASIPIHVLARMFTVIWIGFIINFISGAMLFSADAVRFITSTVFLIKLACLVAGGITIWILARMLLSENVTGAGGQISAGAKTVASLSIIFWVSAIVAGRLTAYIG